MTVNVGILPQYYTASQFRRSRLGENEVVREQRTETNNRN